MGPPRSCSANATDDSASELEISLAGCSGTLSDEQDNALHCAIIPAAWRSHPASWNLCTMLLPPRIDGAELDGDTGAWSAAIRSIAAEEVTPQSRITMTLCSERDRWDLTLDKEIEFGYLGYLDRGFASLSGSGIDLPGGNYCATDVAISGLAHSPDQHIAGSMMLHLEPEQRGLIPLSHADCDCP